MQRLKQKMDGRPFVILGVDSGEDAQDAAAFLEKIKITFPVLPDPDGAVTKRWKVYGLPTSFLIDAEGHLRYALTGPTEWDENANMQLINNLFP
jgi:peroxiredoxin